MNIHDFGTFDRDMILFGGVYSNRQALDALEQAATGYGIGPDAMICTGDLVAYCGDPVAVVDRAMELGFPVVAGNCEIQLAAGALGCGCGFEAGTACDILSRGWYAHASGALSSRHRDYFRACPDIGHFVHNGRRFAVIHGGVNDVARFIWSNAPDAIFDREIADLVAHLGPVDGVVAGHSGIAFTRQIGGVTWINAGVIGMPPNRGMPAVECVRLGRAGPEILPLSYDHHGARAAMMRAGLTQGYHEALVTGHWPNEDILPPDLRRDQSARG